MALIPIPLSKKMLLYMMLLVLLLMAYPILKQFPTTASNSLLVSGGFKLYDNIKTKGLVRITQEDGSKFGLNYTSTLLPPFDSGKGGFGIHTIESNEEQNWFLLGGSFIVYDGVAATHIVAIDIKGKPVPSFNMGSGFNNIVQVIKRSPWNPDKYYVGGDFITYNGNKAPGIARLNSDGTMDTSFIGNGVRLVTYNEDDEEFVIKPGRITTIAFHKSKELICFGGSFSHFNDVPHNNIACVNDSHFNFKATLSAPSPFDTFDDPFSLSLGFFQLPPGATEFSPVSAYIDEVDKIKIDEANDKIYISGQFNSYANKDASGQFTPDDAQPTGNFCRLNIDGSFDLSYPYEGILAKRMDFVLDEANAVIIGAGKYDGNDDGTKTNYASLIKFDRETKALVPGFAVKEDILINPSGVPFYDGGVHSKKIHHGTGEWSDYVYLLQGREKFNNNGEGYSFYNISEEHPPLIRIHRETGQIDTTFQFGPINSKGANTFIVLKENDYGLFDWAIDAIFDYWGIDPESFFS